MFDRLLYGNKRLRKSRLHDEKGNFVGWWRLLHHAPLAFSTGLLRVFLDYRPEIPWIAYDAIKLLKKFLNKGSRVLEFGSGMSTLWYAKLANQVYSVEDCQLWYNKVDTLLKAKSVTNVEYYFAKTPEEYCTFMAHDSVGFDLIMIDGSQRSACVAQSIKLLRSGGILYLDNSDKHSTSEGGDTRLAESYALAFAQQQSAKITYITDFAPTQFFVQQGLLIQLPKS